MEICIQSSQEIISLKVGQDEKIYQVKEKLRDKEGLPLAQQRLMLDEKQLKDNYALSDYNIRSKTVLVLQFLFEIEIKFEEKIITLNVSQNDTILNLKEMIQGKVFIPTFRQKLIFNGNVDLTDDTTTLSDYHITKNSTFHLKYEDVKISINDLKKSKTVVLKVNPSATVFQLKLKLQELIKINPTRHRLMLDKKELVDNQTLFHYEIFCDSTLDLVLS